MCGSVHLGYEEGKEDNTKLNKFSGNRTRRFETDIKVFH
jgi:hypothetical protein